MANIRKYSLNLEAMTSEKTLDACVRGLFEGIRFTAEPKGLYDPLRYMVSIGGKRIRPKLCLLAYTIFKGGLSEEVFEPAVALEVFHSFTLIHDDIMDKSPLRRGKETVWKKWNEDTAILSGDVMVIDAYKRICDAPSSCRGKAMELFNRTAAQVCEGQQYDMEFEGRDDVSAAEYEMMIGLKTAVLIACAAKMGALIAGASDEECDALYRYGYDLGLAFQVADDYLDAYGDEKVFGKPIGGDILNGKKSWLTIRALEKLEDRETFLSVFDAEASTEDEKAAKIAAVKGLYDGLGVADDARSQIRALSARAMEAVSGIALGEEEYESLKVFCGKLVGRAY